MPCNSDYLEQNGKERELQRTAKLLKYVYRKLQQPISLELQEAANDYYCSDDYVAELCGVLSNLDDNVLESLVYNARNKKSRRLADWWEKHQKADRKRIRQEKEAEEMKEKRQAALSKLTKEDREVLGLTKADSIL